MRNVLELAVIASVLLVLLVVVLEVVTVKAQLDAVGQQIVDCLNAGTCGNK